MAKASDNLFPKVILEEVANDGSATTTPAADHRALFLGEDGALHLKDSAAAVTDVGGSGGIAETLLDAKGDLIAASAADTAVRVAVGANGTFLKADSTATGGVSWDTPAGGSAWTQTVDQSGASFASFTAGAGTWASDGTVINQTDTTAAVRRAKYNTLIPNAAVIWEAEIRINNSSGTRRAGLLLAYDGGTGTGGFAFYLEMTANVWRIERDAVDERQNGAFTVNEDTWYKLRVLLVGRRGNCYVDGTLVGTADVGDGNSEDARFVGLLAYGADASFRNIKGWTLTLPA